jgi:hypothetical protein
MSALFADTFYWIALADLTDSAHRRAMALTVEWKDSLIVTTDEVLAEYLTFFAMAPEQMRRKSRYERAAYFGKCWSACGPAKPRIVSVRHSVVRIKARQGLQSDGLHFNADDAEGTAD